MSMRQPESKKAKGKRQKTRDRRAEGRRTTHAPSFAFCLFTFDFLVFHICHLQRPEASEELGGALALELGVAGFNQNEEAVARGEREVRRVEDGVIWLRQSIEREHTEDGEERRAQDRTLERDGDERGPTVVGLAADVDREVKDLDVDLHQEAERAAQKAAQKDDERHVRLVHGDGLGQLLYGVGREGVNSPVALP